MYIRKTHRNYLPCKLETLRDAAVRFITQMEQRLIELSSCIY